MWSSPASKQSGDAHPLWKDDPTVVRHVHATALARVAFIGGGGCRVPLDQVEAVRTASYPG